MDSTPASTPALQAITGGTVAPAAATQLADIAERTLIQEHPTVFTRTDAYCVECRTTTDQVFAWRGYDLGQDTYCLDCGTSLIDDEMVTDEINQITGEWDRTLTQCVSEKVYDAVVAAAEFLALAERTGIELAIADATDGLDAAYARVACYLAHPARTDRTATAATRLAA